MSIATTIKDNTDDGRNIVRFLIDVMDDNIDDATLSHRLAAARLLTVYGHDDAPEFIEDNTPEKDETNSGRRIWLEIDEAAQNPVYAKSYKDCPDPECEVHGNPPPLEFDPNDHHY